MTRVLQVLMTTNINDLARNIFIGVTNNLSDFFQRVCCEEQSCV